MFLEDAAVLDHGKAGGTGALGRHLVHHAFLHPDDFGLRMPR